MKTNIATDRSESERLLSAGVKPETSDMHRWVNSYGQEFLEIHLVHFPAVSLTPAWSLSVLLALIPHTIETREYDEYYFSLANEYEGCAAYKAAYKPCWSDWEDDFVGKRSADPIEACVQLIEWLLANGYSLNQIEV